MKNDGTMINLCLSNQQGKKHTQLKPVQSNTGKTTIHPVSSNYQGKNTLLTKTNTQLKPVQSNTGKIQFHVIITTKTSSHSKNTPVQSKTGKTTIHSLSGYHQEKPFLTQETHTVETSAIKHRQNNNSLSSNHQGKNRFSLKKHTQLKLVQ